MPRKSIVTRPRRLLAGPINPKGEAALRLPPYPSSSKFRITQLCCLETFDDQESSFRNDSEFCSAQITSIGILKRRTDFQQELPKDAGGRFFLMGVQIFRREQKLHAYTGVGMG